MLLSFLSVICPCCFSSPYYAPLRGDELQPSDDARLRRGRAAEAARDVSDGDDSIAVFVIDDESLQEEEEGEEEEREQETQPRQEVPAQTLQPAALPSTAFSSSRLLPGAPLPPSSPVNGHQPLPHYASFTQPDSRHEKGGSSGVRSIAVSPSPRSSSPPAAAALHADGSEEGADFRLCERRAQGRE